jgi:hypothetical protein
MSGLKPRTKPPFEQEVDAEIGGLVAHERCRWTHEENNIADDLGQDERTLCKFS